MLYSNLLCTPPLTFIHGWLCTAEKERPWVTDTISFRRRVIIVTWTLYVLVWKKTLSLSDFEYQEMITLGRSVSSRVYERPRMLYHAGWETLQQYSESIDLINNQLLDMKAQIFERKWWAFVSRLKIFFWFKKETLSWIMTKKTKRNWVNFVQFCILKIPLIWSVQFLPIWNYQPMRGVFLLEGLALLLLLRKITAMLSMIL